MEAALYGKLIISSLVIIIAGWLFQDQADRYNGKVATFFQRALTIVVILAMIMLAGSIIAVIWVNN
jgi:hypothetical protein